MARPRREIPIDDVKGLKTLLAEGMQQKDIAEYYGVDPATISRRIKDLDK